MAVAGKLSPAAAVQIRAAAAAGESYTALAAKYGVHRTTISRLARGVSYSTARGHEAVPPRPRWKLRCVNGHLLAENRGARGRCRTCSRDRSRARRAAETTSL